MNRTESNDKQTNNIEALYPLTPAQQGMLFHTRASNDPTMYFEQHRCTLHGQLDRAAFEEAWQTLIQRHVVLRSLFVWKRRDPLQLVQKQVALPWTYEDWRDVDEQDLEPRFEQFLIEDRTQGFDLAQAPLMRLALIQISEEEHRFVWSFHHAVIDGWSASIIFRELFALYDALAQSEASKLPAPLPYQEYVRWLQAQDMAVAESFWRQTFSGLSTPTSIPTSTRLPGASPTDVDRTYAEQMVTLSAETTTLLQTVAREYRVTANTVLLGAWALLLSKYSGEDDVLFGATVSGRPAELQGVEEMVGMFINTLPVRAKIDPAQSVGQWLQALQAQQVAARQYEFTPLVEIQDWSDVPNDLPFFDSIVLYENHPVDSTLWKGNERLRVRDVQVFEQTNYDLTLVSWPASEFPLQLRYAPSRYDDDSISFMLANLRAILDGFASDAAQSVAEVSALTPAMRHTVLRQWNETALDLPAAQSAPALFEAQAAQTPNDVALISAEQTITYAELNQLANRIAHKLIEQGIAKGDHVAICIERSPVAIASMLAVLKAGAAYVPLDPAYPLERLYFQLADSQAPLLLLQEGLALEFSDYSGITLSVDEDASVFGGGIFGTGDDEKNQNPSIPIAGDDAAYLIYTSGSTGRPKGVRGLHRGVVNRCAWMQREYPFSINDLCCQKTALSFVDSIYEIFGPLLQGVPLLIISGEVARDPVRLVRELAAKKVTRLIVVPSLLRTIMQTHSDLAQKLPDLTLWTSSGETLSVDLAHSFCKQMPHATLLNLYGSSEVSADVTAHQVRGNEEDFVPIGKPIANTRLYLLDRDLNPVPLGIPGEIYIGGASLAAGYWAQPELTAERFMNIDDFGFFLDEIVADDGEQKLFRTGDLARYASGGTIEYLGRIDNQVKIRGMRVELGEIENALDGLPTVRESAVVLHKDETEGEPHLIAYVASTTDAEVEPEQLQDQLADRLPEHMIPRFYSQLEALPLLPNGKLDRNALPEPRLEKSTIADGFVAPDGPVEEMLADVWCEVLNLEEVGVHDNFFRLGGHSLLATQVASQLLQEFEIVLPLQLLFDAPTITALSPLVEEILMKEMA